MTILSLYKGDSSDIITVRPKIADPSEVISDDWVCKTILLNEDGSEVFQARIENTKTDDELYFVVALSPEDTKLVTVTGDVNRCKWVIQLENNTLSPAYRREKHIQVNVKKQGIQDA